MRYLNLLVPFFALVVSTSASAQSKSLFDKDPSIKANSSSIDANIDYTQYLSPHERLEVGTKIVEDRIREAIKTGEIHDYPKEGIEITFSGTIMRAPDESEAAEGAVSAKAVIVVGLFNCSLNTQAPHPGSGPSGPNHPKAKTSGSCNIDPTYQGSLPPTLTWELEQYLTMIPANNPMNTVTYPEVHPRVATGGNLSQSWNATTATVFADCDGTYAGVSGGWIHTDMMRVVVSPPWFVNGTNPFFIDSTSGVNPFNGC